MFYDLLWLAHTDPHMDKVDLIFWIICNIYYTIKIMNK